MTEKSTSRKPYTVPTDNEAQRLGPKLERQRNTRWAKEEQEIRNRLKQLTPGMALERGPGQETKQQLREMREVLTSKQQEDDRLLAEIHQQMEKGKTVARNRARQQEQERNRRVALERESRETKKTSRQQEEQKGEIQLINSRLPL